MLPDEAVDTTILWDGFDGAIGGLVCRGGAVNGHIVDIGYGVLGNLWLKDVCYVVMENGDCVSPTHREFGETECTIWCLKGGVVVRCFGEHMFIIADIQVKHSSTDLTCELLGDLFSERSDARVLDCDCIEGFEAVDQMKGFSFFFCYAEPVRVV